jgi:hypothetical protein
LNDQVFAMHQFRFSRLFSVNLFVLAALSALVLEVLAEDLCPAVNCDCGAIAQPVWKEKCIEAERQTKQACVVNGGTPTQYCTLQGPLAMPVAISTPRPAVPPTEPASLRLYKRQIVMLLWSVKDDLDNVQRREQQGFFGDALQVHKLLENNVERLYATQWRLAEGERQRTNDAAAQTLWRDYREELQPVVASFVAYGDVLWNSVSAAKTPQAQKAYRVLAMRVLRTASMLHEHLALAYAGEANTKDAALAWQQAAYIASSLADKEIATTNKAEHIAYYRYQSAARWNRASFYWMDMKDEARIESAVKNAEQVLAVE